jgi:phospholipase C
MLGAVQHIVVLMLENRSFDHMLGLLYADQSNKSPSGQPFEGLTGNEANADTAGKSFKVTPISSTQAYAYFMPGVDPGEGYVHTNAQLFGTGTAPAPAVATCRGFVTDLENTLRPGNHVGSVLPGTAPENIMGVFPPAMLPVLSGLARGYAVCDHWFSSVPTETMPNRAFAVAATSDGTMDDKTKSFKSPSIFGALSKQNVSWVIYGYDEEPLTRLDFPDTLAASDDHFGLFADFQKAAAAGALAAFTFLEPSWGSTGNSQHPNYDVALGEQLIHDIYYALRKGPGWNSTLLIVTYDEHGGCYDHVPPPLGAVPPDAIPGEGGFDFKRFGVRVPAVLVSPLIPPGTVFRVPSGATPFDHTSILKTIETRWQVPALTKRDAAAVDVGGVLTLSVARTDDPLAGVIVPKSPVTPHKASDPPSHLQELHAKLASQLPVAGETAHSTPRFTSGAECAKYIRTRTQAWKASKTNQQTGRGVSNG